jgi:SpoVK/Ycf46/Vps4 family AAA+-type ATPase
MEGKLKCRCLLLTGMPGAGKTLLSRRILDETEGIKTIIGNGNVFSDFVEDISKKLVGAKLPLYKLIDKLKESKKK